MDNLSIEVGNGVHLRATSSYIRLQVFVLERSLALSDEFDQKDQSDTIYSVLLMRPFQWRRLVFYKRMNVLPGSVV